MKCQVGHWVHRDQEDGPALDKRKGNGNTGGGVLVQVPVDWGGVGGKKAGAGWQAPQGVLGVPVTQGPGGSGWDPGPALGATGHEQTLEKSRNGRVNVWAPTGTPGKPCF